MAKKISASFANGEHKLIVLTEEDDVRDYALDNVTIQALGGDDTIDSEGKDTTIELGAGNDKVINSGLSAMIDGGTDDDNIENKAAYLKYREELFMDITNSAEYTKNLEE